MPHSSGHVGAAPAFSVDVGTGLEAAQPATATITTAAPMVEHEHLVIRREDYVAGTRERPEVRVFTQTHSSRRPVPVGARCPRRAHLASLGPGTTRGGVPAELPL
jgi:hypothetical protein